MSDKQQQQQKDAKEAGTSRGPRENPSVFKQLFATLEAEHQKLQDLEQRRLKLTEELKSMREMLQQKKLKMRQSQAEQYNKINTEASGSRSTAKKGSGGSSSAGNRSTAGGSLAVQKSILKMPKSKMWLKTQP